MYVCTHTTVFTQCVSSLAGNCCCSQAVPAALAHAHHRLRPAYARLGVSAQLTLGNMLLMSAASTQYSSMEGALMQSKG